MLICKRNKIIGTFLLISFINISAGEVKPSDIEKKEILPPCQSCKTVANSVLYGMGKTNKKHFGGGDTAWEEEKLGNYAESEMRLIEIQEKLCSEVILGQSQCYSLAEAWELFIEEWWYEQKNLGDLYTWLCINKVEHCCLDHHYGPKCTPCQGYPDNVCSNNGKCKGSGTRKGDGQCTCNTGYIGSSCDECNVTYYESYRDDEKLLCSKCHAACNGPCTKAGPKGCTDCNIGWIKDETYGCQDINECTFPDVCESNQFCINTDGSYSCLVCDDSCNGCHGDGPDMCDECADGYFIKDGFCVDTQNISDWTRYFTYLGLCIATCIIFQKNTMIAGIIGLSVAVYVAVSEYMLNSIAIENKIL